MAEATATKEDIEMGDKDDKAVVAKPVEPLRFTTPEYILYALYLVWVFYSMFVIIADFSEPFNGNRPLSGVGPGWLFGRFIDMRDHQYRNFRENLPLVAVVATVFLLLSAAAKQLSASTKSLTPRLVFYSLASLGYLVFLHEFCVIFMVAIVTVNFVIAKVLGGHAFQPFATWIFNCVVLYMNEINSGYRFGKLFGSSYAWMDNHRGIIPWNPIFNMVMLRMVSFNMDYYWMKNHRKVTDRTGKVIDFEAHQTTCSQCKTHGVGGACYWWREKAHQPEDSFHFICYFVYLFYVPLQIAGPTTSFNALFSQIRNSQKSHTVKDIVIYALRLAFAILLMEVAAHYFYVIAISHAREWVNFSPAQIGSLGLITLNFIWLKFLIIWRTFRLWAMIDGIESPENMNRCVNNNYSVQGFWRSWHRAFNRWLIRYVFVPLGGSAPNQAIWRRIFNIAVVFTFVALWHDLKFDLLMWGWSLVLFFTPEIVITEYFKSKKRAWIWDKWYFRHLKSLGAAVNILFLMIANLIGFSVGVEGVLRFLDMIFSVNGVIFCFAMFFAFFAASQLMMEYRRKEEIEGKKEDF